jgi:predicted O-methyltransferase YrrM
VSTAEPTSEREARDWVAERLVAVDPFREIQAETERHRIEHGCDAYASADGPLLGVLARAVRARRILEIGTALGYSAAWLAHGAPEAHVDTIEADAAHAEAAEAQLRRGGVADRVQIHVGRSPAALEPLEPGFDLVFYDAHVPMPADLEAFWRLLRTGALLVTSNLFLGQYDPAIPGLEQGAEYRRKLFDPERWLTTFADLKALSVKL